jgi:hypothetical protein
MQPAVTVRMPRRSLLTAVLAISALAAVPLGYAAKPETPGKPAHAGKPADPGKPDDPASQPGADVHGNGTGKAKGVTYVFKGIYQGDAAVDVDHGNAHVKRADLIGETATFDLADAKVVVADSNADGQRDLSDVATGDRVVVKSRMPRTEPAEQPFPARQLVDQTHADQS